MLFNSPEFIGVFLPLTLLGFFVLGRRRPEWGMGWLVLASLFFYGWWKIEYVPVLVGSVVANYAIGSRLCRRPSRALLALGVAGNLGLLVVFKYSFFLTETIGSALSMPIGWMQLALPLGISFFTFQQIAFLVDAQQGRVERVRWVEYGLFVTFFPQLIAGPIVHHREMMPQFQRRETFRPKPAPLVEGFTFFLIGLFKKVVLADGLFAPRADRVFDGAAAGEPILMVAAWIGAGAYVLQLYFDFSGYSDMAIGLGRMCSIRLPVNFDSPYKAHSLVEFWQRWHISLTRFFTSYLFNPMVLAITRRRVAAGKPVFRLKVPAAGPFLASFAAPAALTMFLIGIWHGAGWQFVVFGAIHAVALVANHAWRALHRGSPWPGDGLLAAAGGTALTLLVWTLSLVFFRAESVPHALSVLAGMSGAHGLTLPEALRPLLAGAFAAGGWLAFGPDVIRAQSALWVVGGFAACWLLPNSQQWMGYAERAPVRAHDPAPPAALGWLPPSLRQWSPTPLHGALLGGAVLLVLAQYASEAPSRFLYFNF